MQGDPRSAGRRPALFVSLSLVLLCAAPAAHASTWSSGFAAYEDALARQRADGVPMAVYFYTDWCGYCRQLDEALAQETADRALDGINCVRVNPEKSPEARALATRFGVTGYPSVYVLAGGSDRPQRVRHFTKRGKTWALEDINAMTAAWRQAAGLSSATRPPAREDEPERPYQGRQAESGDAEVYDEDAELRELYGDEYVDD
jgi:thiol-disulfide isomerase/thioredoxin